MSREIVYAKKFIKLSNGVVLPMLLTGSSNSTMFVGFGRKEILERYWWPFYNFIDKTGTELITWAEKHVEGEDPSYQWFTEGSKWITNEIFPKWIKNCVQKASSIEDILAANPGISFFGSLSFYDSSIPYPKEGHCVTEKPQYLHTTQEIEEWLEKAKERKENWEKGDVDIHLKFSTIKPLKSNSISKNLSGPVICSPQRGYYLVDYSERGYSYNKDIHKALIFESEEDFKEKGLDKRVYGYKLLSAKLTEKEKNFVITAVSDRYYSGQYVQRLTSSRLHFTPYSDSAKKFEKEKEAWKYIEEKLRGRFPGVKEFEVRNLKGEEK